MLPPSLDLHSAMHLHGQKQHSCPWRYTKRLHVGDQPSILLNAPTPKPTSIFLHNKASVGQEAAESPWQRLTRSCLRHLEPSA